jgi:hypothetical protein
MSDSEFLKQGSIPNHDWFAMQGGQNSPANAVLEGFGINKLDVSLLCKANDSSTQWML